MVFITDAGLRASVVRWLTIGCVCVDLLDEHAHLARRDLVRGQHALDIGRQVGRRDGGRRSRNEQQPTKFTHGGILPDHG